MKITGYTVLQLARLLTHFTKSDFQDDDSKVRTWLTNRNLLLKLFQYVELHHYSLTLFQQLVFTLMQIRLGEDHAISTRELKFAAETPL